MSTSCESKKLIPIILLILINLLAYATAQPHTCTTNGGYTNNSSYDVNLNALINTLSLNIPDYGYYASSIRVLSREESVYALALCRGDQTPDQCRTCVQSASSDLLRLCRNQRQGVIWYDNCMVRYSNTPLREPNNILYILSNGYNASNLQQFKADKDGLLNDLRQLAANGSSELKVGAGRRGTSSVGSESQWIYGLAQCTPDLSPEDCRNCLVDAVTSIQRCCDFERGARALKLDCNVRYELYSFYNETRLGELGVLLSS